MKVVTRRRRNFDRSKNQSKMSLRKAYEKRPECRCESKSCQEERWIQVVEAEEPQRMILDFQVADVSKALLAVKKIVEKGEQGSFWTW
eukprot:3133306-Karenia_brevis.AAC.1